MERGKMIVLEPFRGLRFGNYLYFWLHAVIRRKAGDNYFVVTDKAVELLWRSTFPAIFRDLCLSLDSLTHPPCTKEQIPHSFFQNYGIDFDSDEMDSFIRRYLLGPSECTQLSSQGARSVTVNVRRGDYYSEPRLRSFYAFDYVQFIKEAIDAIGALDEVIVISDDTLWCKEYLTWLTRTADTVRFASVGDPVLDFLCLANSRRLILANSTFSYWGAYISNVRFSNWTEVWAPAFHCRSVNSGKAWQLDPRWNIIECD
jgi:hypothetical protein